MRMVLAWLGAGLLAAILASTASGGAAHKGLSARTAQVTTGETPAARSEPVIVHTEQFRPERSRAENSRTDDPQFLIYQRAQQRAQERIKRIEARHRLRLSVLRARPLYYSYYEPVLPWFVRPRFVYFAPY